MTETLLLAAQLPDGRIDDHQPDYAPSVQRVTPRRVILAESVTWTLAFVPLPDTFRAWNNAVYGFMEAA